MVTIKYFYTYFLPLVLHFTVSLYAEESTQNATVDTENAASVIIEGDEIPNVTTVPNILNVPSEFPKATTNCIKVISTNATIISLNVTNIKSNDTNSNCENFNNILTDHLSNESSTSSQDGTSETAIISKSSNPADIANESVTSNTTMNATNVDRTENLTDIGQISNVPQEFPNTALHGTKVLSYNTSLVNTTKTEVKNSDINSTEIKGNDTSKIDTEVLELLKIKEPCNEIQISASDTNNSSLNETENENWGTELIEDGQETEDILRNPGLKDQSSPLPGVPLVQGQLAAILAAVFVVISILTYIGLLSWRRFLETRYGNRELLVNEDDFNDRDDMRHFTI